MVWMFVFLINFTGPVGSYLGIFQGKWALDTISIYAILTQYFPSETTMVDSINGIVCESIVKETLWQGNIAYIRKTIYPVTLKSNFLFSNIFSQKRNLQKEIQEYYDTLFEYGPYLCRTSVLYDTIMVQETVYKTPFSLNLSWSLGLRGRVFIIDGDGEGIPNDTLTFIADSCRIIGIENIQTPYGLIPNAYKIRQCGIRKIHGVIMNYSWRDTAVIISTDWYKDSLWLCKDSTYINERIWLNFGVWILLAELRAKTLVYLKDVLTFISEENNKKIKSISLKSPFIIDLFGKESEIILTNTLGQILYKKTLKEKFILDNKKYQKGIYYLKIRSKEKENLFKLIIM